MSNYQNNQYYIIYKREYAYLLRKLGFKIAKVEPNPIKPELDCYYFYNSEALQRAFHQIK